MSIWSQRSLSRRLSLFVDSLRLFPTVFVFGVFDDGDGIQWNLSKIGFPPKIGFLRTPSFGRKNQIAEMKCMMKVKLIYAAVGISAGFTAGAIFWWRYQNYVATAIAFLSSFCATYLFYVHWAYHKQWLADWSNTRVQLSIIINTVLCLTSLGGLVASIALGIIWAEGIDPESLKGNNVWIVAVWCWMTNKWTMMSAIYTRRYARNVMHPLLVHSDATQTGNGNIAFDGA